MPQVLLIDCAMERHLFSFLGGLDPERSSGFWRSIVLNEGVSISSALFSPPSCLPRYDHYESTCWRYMWVEPTLNPIWNNKIW